MKKLVYVWSMAIGFSVVSAGLNPAGAQEVKVKEETKKGWSKKAKYSVIGTGVGAATGAAVSKNNSKGALIGGAVGAGTGYLYGRHKDKKSPQRKTVYKYKRTVE